MKEQTEFSKFQEALEATIASGGKFLPLTVDEAKRLESEVRVIYLLNEKREKK